MLLTRPLPRRDALWTEHDPAAIRADAANDATVAQSRFWGDLWARYAHVPSVALCRVPELEYASMLDVSGRVLDHCCGDGTFASLAWPDKTLRAGCDIDPRAVERAGRRGRHESIVECDASQALPFDDASFDLVFNNSGLEHIADLHSTLSQIARVLAPGGWLAFALLNHRFYDWWPLGQAARRHYRRIQPIHHALSLEQWRSLLAERGFRIRRVMGYFDRPAAETLARLDYAFCRAHLEGRRSLLVRAHAAWPKPWERHWQRRLGSLIWRTPADAGAGYFVLATRSGRRRGD